MNSPIDKEVFKNALKLNLDGRIFQQEMLPQGRSLEPLPQLKATIKPSAVLILLQSKPDGIHICFTQRKNHLRHHPGQISFPGGKQEETDTNATETALREAAEEADIHPEEVEIIGRLTPLYVQVSHYLIEPIVGFSTQTAPMIANPDEVESILSISLDRLIDETSRSTNCVKTNIGLLEVPCFKIDETIIWGATAMMLAELIGRMKYIALHLGSN